MQASLRHRTILHRMDVASEMAHRYLAPNFFLIHARF